LVRRVEIDKQQVTVVFRVPPTSSDLGPGGGVLPDCRRRVLTCPGQFVPRPL
jgi:hypothetical protein